MKVFIIIHIYLTRTLNYTLLLVYVHGHIKVDVPCFMFDLEGRPIFEWCMVECESRDNHIEKKKKTRVEKRLDYVLKICYPILDAIVHINVGTYIIIQ